MYMKPSRRGACINIACSYGDNSCSASGGVMALWHGVNCSITDSNFTHNKGKTIPILLNFTNSSAYVQKGR